MRTPKLAICLILGAVVALTAIVAGHSLAGTEAPTVVPVLSAVTRIETIPVGPLTLSATSPVADSPPRAFEVRAGVTYTMLGTGYSSSLPTSVWQQTSETAPVSVGTGYIWFTVVNLTNGDRTSNVKLVIKDTTGARSTRKDSVTVSARTMYLAHYPLDWSQAGSVPAGIYEVSIRVKGAGGKLKNRACVNCR